MGILAGSLLAFRFWTVGGWCLPARSPAGNVPTQSEPPTVGGRKSEPVKLEVWHNILWSNYKAGVFSEMARLCAARGIDLSVIQIAETDSDRVGLSQVDMSRHRYAMTLLFKGTYSAVPTWKLVWAAARRAATTQADLVVLAGYHRPEFIVQAFILWLRGKPRAVFCDSTAFDRPHIWWKTLAKRVSFWLCDYVFCYGQRAREYVRSLGVPMGKTFVRCQAAALPDDYNSATVPAQRVAHAPGGGELAGGAPLFVYVGRLSPEKRLDVLIRAFAEARGAMPGAKLRLVGSGPQREALEALVAALGLGEAVELPGGQSKAQLYANYLAATAMVLPSHSEPWGLVVNEALHFGCPVIVSNRCGCVPELVEHSDCGSVVRCDDVADLAAALVAAPGKWADREAVAVSCLRRIAPFYPQNAAGAILDGVTAIVARKRAGGRGGAAVAVEG